MKSLPRLAALGATAAVTVTLTGCGTDEESADPTAPPPAAATSAPPTSAAAEQGVTAISDIYGPFCAQVPTEGEGSAEGTVDDSVATAADNNPLLSTLATAVETAGLVDTLNGPDAAYTVSAPATAAFEALPARTVDAVLADPQGQLTDILTHHFVTERYDAEGLAERGGQVTTVQGDRLVIPGEPMGLVIDEQEQATVLCGNIPTANATVFVIDQVLMPPAA